MTSKHLFGHLPIFDESANIDKTAMGGDLSPESYLPPTTPINQQADLVRIPRVSVDAIECSEDVARTHIELVKGDKLLLTRVDPRRACRVVHYTAGRQATGRTR